MLENQNDPTLYQSTNTTKYFKQCITIIPVLLEVTKPLSSQHYSVPVPSQEKLGGLWQKSNPHTNGWIMEVGGLEWCHIQMDWTVIIHCTIKSEDGEQ